MNSATSTTTGNRNPGLEQANIQTTFIYANYSNKVIDREMEKFKINVPAG